MPPTPNLVVDADLGCSASETSNASIAKLCAAILEEIRLMGYLVTVSNQGLEEWKDHCSRFGLRWLRALNASRRLTILEHYADPSLRKCVYHTTKSEAERKSVSHDMHLVEAAILAKYIIISNDKKARKLFKTAKDRCTILRHIVWMCATVDSHQVLEWLVAGAAYGTGKSL